MFSSIGAALVWEALTLARRRLPDVEVVTREGSTPALVRGLRAATLDLALISSRPPYPAPDDQDPPLELEVLLEGDLLGAVPAAGDLGRDGSVSLAELESSVWITSPQPLGEPALGVWPALARRPAVGHQTGDWLSKLALVAGGWGVTTLPPSLVALVPAAVRVVRVTGGAPVTRRLWLARVPGVEDGALDGVAGCLREAASHLPVH